VELDSPELTRRLRESLATGATLTRRAGIPLVVLTVPCLDPSDREVALTGAGLRDARRVRWLNARLREFAAHTRGVHLVDLGRHVCRSGGPGPDGVHFSPAAAASAWRWLAPRLEPLLR
jgi:hypothetical protein